jgi:hypothetical protein
MPEFGSAGPRAARSCTLVHAYRACGLLVSCAAAVVNSHRTRVERPHGVQQTLRQRGKSVAGAEHQPVVTRASSTATPARKTALQSHLSVSIVERRPIGRHRLEGKPGEGRHGDRTEPRDETRRDQSHSTSTSMLWTPRRASKSGFNV